MTWPPALPKRPRVWPWIVAGAVILIGLGTAGFVAVRTVVRSVTAPADATNEFLAAATRGGSVGAQVCAGTDLDGYLADQNERFGTIRSYNVTGTRIVNGRGFTEGTLRRERKVRHFQAELDQQAGEWRVCDYLES